MPGVPSEGNVFMWSAATGEVRDVRDVPNSCEVGER